MDEEDEEPVVCSDCEETPELFYAPTTDSPYRVKCGCEGRGIDVTDSVNPNALVEAMTGKWSNFDHDSTMRY